MGSLLIDFHLILFSIKKCFFVFFDFQILHEPDSARRQVPAREQDHSQRSQTGKHLSQ